MALRITCTIPAPLNDALEDAVRQVFAAEPADVHAYITFAADDRHAEVVVLESGAWRAAYYASLGASAAEHVAWLRDALGASPAVR